MDIKELWQDDEKRPYLLTGGVVALVLVVVFVYLSMTKPDAEGSDKLSTNDIATITEITDRYLTVSGNYGAKPISDNSEFYPRLTEVYKEVKESYTTKFSAYYDMKLAYYVDDTDVNVLLSPDTLNPDILPVSGGFYTVSSDNLKVEKPEKYFLNSNDEKTVMLDFSMDTKLVWYTLPITNPEEEKWDKTFIKVVNDVHNDGRLTMSQQMDGEWKIVNVELNTPAEEGGLLAFDTRGQIWNIPDESKIVDEFKVEEYPTTNIWIDQQACVARNVC